MSAARKIEVVKDAAVSGYSRADALMKPYIAVVDDKRLVDSRGRVRRFSTKLAASEAAARFAWGDGEP